MIRRLSWDDHLGTQHQPKFEGLRVGTTAIEDVLENEEIAGGVRVG
jgi:hypothetical protein